jgi:hypothetical protein
MATATYHDFVGANPAATVLANLQTGPAAVKAALSAALNSTLRSQRR